MGFAELKRLSHSNFFFGVLFMGKSKRRAVKAIYEFCRASDDAVDSSADKGAERLAWWREELARCFENKPRHPVTAELAKHLKAFGLNREYFDKLLSGYEMDVARRRYQTQAELLEYCDCVAGSVGALVLKILGLQTNPRAREYCEHLSRGLQMTNIIRDLGEDLARGRIYLPREDFTMVDYTEDQLKAGEANENYFKLMRFQVGKVRGYFRKAQMSLEPWMRRGLLGPEVMRETYEALLRKMEKMLEYSLDRNPPSLSLFERFTIACSTWFEVK